MAVKTIGSPAGLQAFLENLAKAYVKRANIVLAYSNKSHPKELQVELGLQRTIQIGRVHSTTALFFRPGIMQS